MKINHPDSDNNLELHQSQANVRRLQLQLQGSITEVDYLRAHLYQTQADLQQTQIALQQTQIALQQEKGEIAAMKSSKFWKLRTLWFKIKAKFKKIFSLRFLSKDRIPLKLEQFINFKPTLIEDEDIASSNLLPSILPVASAPVTPSSGKENVLLPQGESYKEVLLKLYKTALKSFLILDNKLKLPTTETNPLVSIILVLYNRAELTLQCLNSLSVALSNSSFLCEVIVVDNASSDETSVLLDQLDGIKIIRNHENINFLLASNQAARESKGEYILFLNNDTQIMPESIDSVVKTIKSSDDIGAVGGKIILLDGSLQEAGSIVWKDGSCLGYGRGDDPFSPAYMFMRDVDYCSGAFLLTRRNLFIENEGFDEDYKPAYYEETDYCLRLWEQGKRVVYDPHAIVLHYEFASSTSVHSALELQSAHREIFVTKHKDKLQSHYVPQESNILLARNATKPYRRILLIDDRVPHTFLGSGYPRAREILLSLLKLNCFVTFYPLYSYKEEWSSIYQDIPKQIEVMNDYGTANFQKFLDDRKGFYDELIISRPHNMQKLKPILSNAELIDKTRVIYDAEAIFAIREVQRRRLAGEEVPDSEVDVLVRDEIQLASGVNSIISVSKPEAKKFKEYGFNCVYTLGHTLSINPSQNHFQGRYNILFIGAIHADNAPNADSVFWFVKEVLPKIKKQLNGNVDFMIVGFNTSEKILDLAKENDDVKVFGQVDDLQKFYNQSKIFVVPARFAAGIPLKLLDAAANGLPIVCTSLIASQVEWEDGIELLVADDPTTFAEQCVKLYTQPQLWEKLRHNALMRVKQECSEDSFTSQLKEILK